MKTSEMESVNIDTLAKSIGMHPITCPHCAKKFPMDKMIDALFQRIIEAANEGKRVLVNGFGLFFVKHLKGHSIVTKPTKGHAVFSDINLLHFRQSVSTRKALNPDRVALKKKGAKP